MRYGRSSLFIGANTSQALPSTSAEDEWLAVGAWCWENFDILSGVSFLPKADDAHIYEAAPYEEISSEEYSEMKKKTNFIIDWDNVAEEDDNTIGSQELACTAGACEI